MTKRSDAISTARAIRRSLLRLRLLLSALGVVLLSVGFILWLVTRPWFIIDRVEPILSRLSGGTVDIAHAAYQGDGKFLFQDLTVRADTLEGPAAQICHIGRAIVEVDPSKLMRGKIEVKDIELNEVRIRLSEDERVTGAFNLAALQPKWPADAGAMLPPRISINDAVIELGVHRGKVFREAGRRSVSGSLRPDGAGKGWYNVRLVEIDDGGSVLQDGGLIVDGQWNVLTSEHSFRLDNVELNESAYGMCPHIARLWWDRMALEGRVRNLKLHWSPETDFEVVFAVEDVGLTLPIETADLWARYRNGRIDPAPSRPRMQVHSGSLVLTRHSLALQNLAGELVSASGDEDVTGVPYEVSLRIDELIEPTWEDRETWMDETLATAPFTMGFNVKEFRVEHGPDGTVPGVELPAAMARVLERFELSDWMLTTSIEVARGSPTRDADGRLVPAPILSKGHALIARGAGRYERFPYPLSNLSAFLEFTNDRVLLHSLTGDGPTGATVRLSGSIAPPGRNAAVDLRLTARDVPVDEHLRGALNEGQRKVFDALLSDAAHAAVTTSVGGDDRDFTLGGIVHLDINLTRQLGLGHRIRAGGSIDIDSVGVVFDRFPYPFMVTGGALDWSPEQVSVVLDADGRGLPIVTYGGGSGDLRGAIDIERDEDGKFVSLRPDLHFGIKDDHISDGVRAAFEHAKTMSESTGNRPDDWVRRLGLEGAVDYSAHVAAGKDGGIDYDVTAALRDGSASGAAFVRDVVGGEVANPEDWRLDECEGEFSVTQDRLEIDRFTARYGEGALAVSGYAELGSGELEAELHLAIDDVALRGHLLDLLPNPDAARQIWTRYQPTGTVDADLVHRRSGGTSTTQISLDPEHLALHVEGQPITLEQVGGEVHVTGGELQLDALVFDVECEGTAQGQLIADGRYAWATEEKPLPTGRIEIDWLNGRFESEIVPTLLDMTGVGGIRTRYEAFAPRGTFDAALSWTPEAAKEARYELLVRPEMLAVHLNDRVLSFVLDPEGAVRLTPERTVLEGIRATNAAGWFEIEGTLERGSSPRAVVSVDFEGKLMHPEALALLPRPVQQTLEALELEERGPSRIEHLMMELAVGEDGTMSGVRGGGRLVLDDASLRAGVHMESVYGPFALSFERRGDAPTQFDIRARPDRMRILGQRLRNIEADLSLDPAKQAVLLEGLCADVGQGRITGTAQVGLGPEAPYSASLQLVAVPMAEFLFVRPGTEKPPQKGPEGALFASVDLSGHRGDLDSRVGRGVARVMGERLAGIPAALKLMQLFHATVPPDAWDYLATDFFITGRRLVFSDLLIESTSDDFAQQQLTGSGEIDLETFDLKARFSNRGGLHVVREVVGGVGDQLAAIIVEGPLWDPEARLVALPNLRAEEAPSTSAAPRIARTPDD